MSVTKVLNLDLDFFVSPIEQYRSDEDQRLPDDGYEVWDEDSLRTFLENQCGIISTNRTKGWIVKYHKEVFFLWRQLIEKGQISHPFELWHVDAHDDLGSGFMDQGFFDVITRLVFNPPSERPDSDLSKLTSGNYLLFALACRWIKSLAIIRHPEDNEQIPDNILSDDAKYIEIRGWIKGDTNSPPDHVEPRIPFKDLQLTNFNHRTGFDYVFVSLSPSFTPPKADSLVGIIEDYIET